MLAANTAQQDDTTFPGFSQIGENATALDGLASLHGVTPADEQVASNIAPGLVGKEGGLNNGEQMTIDEDGCGWDVVDGNDEEGCNLERYLFHLLLSHLASDCCCIHISTNLYTTPGPLDPSSFRRLCSPTASPSRLSFVTDSAQLYTKRFDKPVYATVPFTRRL
jgi:hypothetical protein